MKAWIAVSVLLLVILGIVALLCLKKAPLAVRVLILPKFEFGEVADDAPGEAYYYYKKYCAGGDEYEIKGGYPGSKLYMKDGVALYVTGMGKVNAALSLAAVLNDSRFDFSHAYLISTGCAGSAVGYGTMGDVFLITAAVDYDLGYKADIRDLADSSSKTTWFHSKDFDSSAYLPLNSDLMDRIYALIKDIPLETTKKTHAFMKAAFDGAKWASRRPAVLRGTTVTSDSYWKGEYSHQNALLVTETYGCKDPYATTEMEDAALAATAKRFGLLDRFIILRDSVNTDCFMNGETPESLWDPDYPVHLTPEESAEFLDIFPVAMKNNFAVGRVVIDAILDGTLNE